MFNQQNTVRRLFRSRTNRQMTGLSGGIAEYMNVDPSLVRIGWVAATFLTFPVAPFVYFIAALIIPSEPIDQPGPVAGDTFII
jgi:phage shock protein PspC (stress-responsive transcriptional regulator)